MTAHDLMVVIHAYRWWIAGRRMNERLVASMCRRCGTRLDAATGVEGDDRPTPGAVSICWSCGTVSLFAEDLRLREPTIEEINAILDDPQVDRLLNVLWADHLAEVTDNDVDFACGCRTTARAGLFTLEACAETCAAAQTVMRLARSQGKGFSVIR